MCRSKIEEATEAMMSEMSLTTRNEVAPVKALGEPGFAPSAPIDPWSCSLTSYVCPACTILTRLKPALQSPVGARIKHQNQTLGSLASKSCRQAQALTISTFN